MAPETQERRSTETTILAISKDEAWLHFAKKTLRRTDEIRILKDLAGISPLLDGRAGQTVVFISSELVPPKRKDFEQAIPSLEGLRVWVLREPHDEHQRINDKHLRQMGVEVADRPDNSKAMRRLIKIVFG